MEHIEPGEGTFGLFRGVDYSSYTRGPWAERRKGGNTKSKKSPMRKESRR